MSKDDEIRAMADASRIDTLALRCSRYERLAAEALRMLGHLDTAQMSTGDYVEAARKAMGQIRDGA